MYKINIDRKQKNRSPPSQNIILNIFLSQRHLNIARLNVMIVDSNYLPSKSWSFEKKRRFVNQSICIWWSHLSFADKVCRQRRQRQFDDFSWRFFFVSVGNFAQFWKYQTIWYAFPTVFPIRILQDVLKNSTTICFFWSAPPIWRIFCWFFSESGGNFALQRAPLLTEFSKYALRAVTPVKFNQTALYDIACGYLELFNYWYCLVFYDIFWY